ncbi:lysosome membrane protein 2-like [Babylonia areolata]|uniref:lysosome membrane protein 2-like n=1 Tax=Babylonia areolata TaxID=304850 RepID=UPI003FD36F0C
MCERGGSSRRRTCLLFCAGVMLLTVGGIMIPVVDMLYRNKIQDAVTITNGSDFWDGWVAPPVPIYMQFYMFNVTNPEAVKNGDKPILAQRGPYTYREERRKESIVFHENDTVSYREKQTFFFQRNMSVGDDTDIITTGNLVVLTAANLLQYATTGVRLVSMALSTAREDLFVERSVKDLLWGYHDKGLEALSTQRPDLIPSTTVGYFVNRNNTETEVVNVFTGKNAVETLGHVDKYNGSRLLPFWSTSWANMINGTDGTIFPPFQQETVSLDVFSSDICRSVNMKYQKGVKTKQGINLRRFVISESQLQNSSLNADNIGYCTPQTKCLPTGLLNLTHCLEKLFKVSVPAVASYPHFYHADPVVQQSVEGMNPDPLLHQTAVDVEPWTGLVLQSYKRMQINMHVQKLDGLAQTYDIRSLYFPIFWISESVEIDNSHATKLQRNFFAPLEISSVLEKVFLTTGGFVLLIITVVVCRDRRQNKNQMGNLPPGPVPTILTNGAGRRPAKRIGGVAKSEAVPLLSDQRGSAGRSSPPSSSPPPPPPPVPSYQRPPLNRGHHHYPQQDNHLNVAATVEPMYQEALDA